jgi:peptide/nickel transport system ATP-binding protein
MTTAPLLSVRDLHTVFHTDAGIVRAVDGVSFDVAEREIFAIVGESGSGKTVTALSILGLIPKPAGKIVSGEITYRGEDLLGASKERLREIRGDRIAMIFQDPLTALNPVYRVGDQIAEVFLTHREISKTEALDKAVELLDLVGIPKARERIRSFPHEFSGGMRQRVMIAMAIALDPDLIIADEPTTALDVTIQAQILRVLTNIRDTFNTAIMLITHDLGVVAEYADTVQVMYAGKVAERGRRDDVYYDALHPYTWGLLQSISRLDEDVERLHPIKGNPPSLINVPPGCPFHPRCPYRFAPCDNVVPPLVMEDAFHSSACHLPVEEKKRIFAHEVAQRS